MKAPTLDQRLAARSPEFGRAVMKQRWESLLFLHWIVSIDEIQKTLPPGLYVDTYDGKAWLGIVPFFMKRIRPVFCPPVPWISWFQELNVRTYVHDDEGIPGVWFYSLDCNQPLAVEIARAFFHLPYQHASMSSVIKRGQQDQSIEYECRRKGCDTKIQYIYGANGSQREAELETLEFFLLERYYLYAWSESSRRLFRGQVKHLPYAFSEAKLDSYSLLPAKQAGFESLGGAPVNQLFSSGVNVIIYPTKIL